MSEPIKCKVGSRVTIPKYSALFSQNEETSGSVDRAFAKTIFVVVGVCPVEIVGKPGFLDLDLQEEGVDELFPYFVNNTQVKLVW